MTITRCRVGDFEPSSSQTTSAIYDSLKYSKGGEKEPLSQPNSAGSKFMSIVPEDLLLQIFLRLPNGRSVIQCANVCKSWYHLAMNPHTRSSFVEYHHRKQSIDSSYHPVYPITILFNYETDNEGTNYQHYQLSSKSPKPKHYDLSFMLNCEDLIIRASSGYFLLLNRGASQYYICNSLTRHWLVLPDAPSIDIMCGSYSYALICDLLDGEEDQDRYRYRVVIVYNCQFFRDTYDGEHLIFDSETGLWTEESFSLPYNSSLRCCLGFDGIYRSLNIYSNHQMAVTGNGVLHWLQGMECLVVFDPLSFEFRHVPLLADDQFTGISPEYGKCEVRLGVVRDRVRLSLMQKSDNDNEAYCGLNLKVWELDSSCFSWILVHDVVLKDICRGNAMCFMLAFHPCDGNVLFLVCGKQMCCEKIYRYEIDQDKYKEICDFPSTLGPKMLEDNNGWRFGVLSLVHPLWPTPALPSN